MPAPARKRSATLARPASESKPILAVVLALIGLFLAVAMITHASNDVSWLPPPDTTIAVINVEEQSGDEDKERNPIAPPK
jgi:hypothetical protein